MKWYITTQSRYGPSHTASVHDENLEYLMEGIINAQLKITYFSRKAPKPVWDVPLVPTIEECERERYRAWALRNEIPKGGDA